MMTRQQKALEISSLTERFGKAKAAFLVDFTGMNAVEVTELRKKLNSVNSEMKVVRNTLAQLALKENADYGAVISKELVGVNAIVFAYEDVSSSAKALTDFSKEVEALKLKTGAMDGQKLDSNQIKYLAELPSKDELRAKLLRTFQEPMSKFVRTMNEVPSGFVRTLSAYKDQKSA